MLSITVYIVNANKHNLGPKRKGTNILAIESMHQCHSCPFNLRSVYCILAVIHMHVMMFV